MKLFLISPADSCAELVEKNIKDKFPERHLSLDDRESLVWIVAAPSQSTPASVSQELGIGNGDDDSLFGLVVQIHDYFGFDNKSLWQQLEVWLHERG